MDNLRIEDRVFYGIEDGEVYLRADLDDAQVSAFPYRVVTIELGNYFIVVDLNAKRVDIDFDSGKHTFSVDYERDQFELDGDVEKLDFEEV